MKNSIKLLMISIIFVSFSCDDFIEVEPKGEIAETYFKFEDDYDKALIGAYDLLHASFWGTQTAVIASPDLIAGGDKANYDQPALQDVDKMIHTPSTNVQIRDIWQLGYAGMNRANFFIGISE